jgi:hypothetical protein
LWSGAEGIDGQITFSFDPNTQGEEYNNMLQVASWGGKKEIVRMLEENRADNACYYYGRDK